MGFWFGLGRDDGGWYKGLFFLVWVFGFGFGLGGVWVWGLGLRDGGGVKEYLV